MSQQLTATQIELLDRNILYLEGDVCGKMADQIHLSLMELEAKGSPPIEVRICTGGGSVRAGLGVYDFLRQYRGKKTGIVWGYALSMGAIILQACDERLCLPHSSVLIHHVNTESVSLDELEDPDRLNLLRKSMQEDQETLYKILVARTGKSKEKVRKACKRDESMTAKEALEFGLVDRIIVFEPFQPTNSNL